MTYNRLVFALLTLGLGSGCLAQQYEIGVAAGYGFNRDLTVKNAAGQEAKTGFRPGWSFGAVGGHNASDRFSGEVRYTFRMSDLHVESGGQEARFDGDTHAVHYDFLTNLAGRESRVIPFLAVGGGVKVYRGTGKETAFQPLSSFVLLTQTTQVKPLITFGGGVKFKMTDKAILRVDFRDYTTGLPNDVLAPNPNARLSGWIHDFVALVGISYAH